MSQANYTDPREQVGFDIEPGMVFHDTRGGDSTEIVITTADRNTDTLAYLDTEGDRNRDCTHNIGVYHQFEGQIGAGRYEPVRDETGDIERRRWMGQIYDLLDTYESRDGRTADHKAEAIQEVIDIIVDDVPADHNDTVDFVDVDGIGEGAAKALRANGFTTKGDVRSATKDEISDVPYMGAKNTERLMDRIEQ